MNQTLAAWKPRLICLLAGVLLGSALVLRFKEPQIVTVDKIQNRVRVVTRIDQRPDGSKTTVITKDSAKTEMHLTSKPVKKDWIVGATSSLLEPVPVFTLQVSRRILGDIYLGVYARTDREFGLGLTFQF
jgi:hypothetical protein